MADLSVKGLKKSFGDHVVLKGVSFDVKSGDFLSLLGPSGCGKTTILRIICGLETADEGEVLVDGADVTKVRPEKRNIGLVFQNYALFPSMNVAKNVGYGLKMHKVPQPEIDERVNEALELVKLGGYNSRRVTQLSGGEQQRVALARALVTKPNILLLDEPLSALDRKVRAEMQYEIRNLQRQIGTATVFVTHDQEEALTMSDQIILLHDGQIEQQGDPFTIYSQPASVFASDFLGKANLLSGVLACEDGVWCVCSEKRPHSGDRRRRQGGRHRQDGGARRVFRILHAGDGGREPVPSRKEDLHRSFSGSSSARLGTQPLDISALGTHAGTLSEGDDLFVPHPPGERGLLQQ